MLSLGVLEDTDPAKFEVHCRKRRHGARTLFDLGPKKVGELVELASGGRKQLSYGFGQEYLDGLANAGILRAALPTAELTNPGKQLLEWFTSSGRGWPMSDKQFKALAQEFLHMAFSAPRVRGLLLLLKWRESFPILVSSSESVRTNVLMDLATLGAIIAGKNELTDKGRAVALWFSA